ncbi:MAG: GatB/YqeY domain-containing protein [Gammaproteobacteria bacterium]
MSSIKQQLAEDLKTAMRGNEKSRRDALRLIMAAIKQIEVDQRQPIDDQKLIGILSKLKKQRQESIGHFQQAKRNDLLEKEQFELEIINHYLPEQLPADEIEKTIQAALQETAASGIRDMGKVMAILNTKLQGRADMAKVSATVKAHLSK